MIIDPVSYQGFCTSPKRNKILIGIFFTTVLDILYVCLAAVVQCCSNKISTNRRLHHRIQGKVGHYCNNFEEKLQGEAVKEIIIPICDSSEIKW